MSESVFEAAKRAPKAASGRSVFDAAHEYAESQKPNAPASWPREPFKGQAPPDAPRDATPIDDMPPALQALAPGYQPPPKETVGDFMRATPEQQVAAFRPQPTRPAYDFDLSTAASDAAGGPSSDYHVPDSGEQAVAMGRQSYAPGAVRPVEGRLYPAEEADTVQAAQELYDEAAKGGGSLAKSIRRPTTPEEARLAFDLQDRVERQIVKENPSLLRFAGITSSIVAAPLGNLYDPATAHADFDTARAVNRARAEAGPVGRFVEGFGRAAGASMLLGRFKSPTGQTVAATTLGAVGSPEDPVGGAAAMLTNVAGSRAARGTIGPKPLPPDASRMARLGYRAKGAYAEGAGSVGAEIATRGLDADPVTAFGLGFGLGAQGDPNAGPTSAISRLRRRLGIPETPAEAARDARATPEEVKADPATPEPQRRAVEEAEAQGVRVERSSVTPEGEGVAEGVQASTNEPRRVQVEAAPPPQESAPDAPTGFRARLLHGSPQGDLSAVRAKPESRQYDNATSRLGAFFTPETAEAQRYAGKGGRVYEADVDLRRPYEMSWGEFGKFQAPEKQADGSPTPFTSERIAARQSELSSEAEALRSRLEAEGYDGIVVRDSRGLVREVASFRDVSLSAPTEAPVRPVEVGVRGETKGPEVDPSRVSLRMDSGDVLTQMGRIGGADMVDIQRTRPDGSKVTERWKGEDWRDLVGVGEAPAVAEKPAESLSQFVRREGGLRYGNEEGLRGELDRLSNKETGTTGLVLKNGRGKLVEEMLQSARESGVVPRDMEVRDFLEALEMDAAPRAEPRRRRQQTEEDYYREMEERYESERDAQFAQEPKSLGDRMAATRFADRDVDPAKLAEGVDVIRGKRASKRLPSEAGVFDPLALVRGAGELVGLPRKGIGKALDLADRGVGALMRGVGNLPGVRQGLDAARVAADVVKEKLSTHMRGREYVSRLDERRGEMALAKSDAREAVEDLSRKADRKPLDPTEQETATEYMTGEADRATAVERLGEEYVARLDRNRSEIDANQREMERLGWMSKETLAEWEGKWLPRVYTKVEQAKREAGGSPTVSVSGSKKIPGLYMRRDRPLVRWREGGKWQNRRFETMEEAEAFAAEHRTGEKARAGAPRGIDHYITKDGESVYRWREGVGENMRVHEKRFGFPRTRLEEVRNEAAERELRKDLEARGIARDRPNVSDVSIIEPIPKEWREAAGEVRDPAVLVARAKASQAAVIANMRLLSDVAKNPKWAAETRVDETFHEEPIPADAKKYGALAGKYVRKPLRDDIVGMFREKGGLWDTAAQIADTALAEWKFGKTVLNPGTHVRNVIGNTVFGEFADFSRFDPSNLRHTGRAVQIMRAKPGDPLHETKRFLIRERIAGGDFFSTEVLELVEAVERSRGVSWGEKVKAYLADKGALLKKGRVMEAIPGAEVASKLYQIEDVLPKMGAWVKYVSGGMEPGAAAARVRKWFPNYGTAWTSALSTTRGLKGAVGRQVGPAFHSFMSESARIIGTAIKEKPATVAALYAGIQAIAAAMRDSAGVSDEEVERLRAASPRWQRPAAFRLILPKRGEKGEVRLLDLSWTLPMGNEVETVRRLLSGEDTEAEIGGGGIEWSPVGPFLTMAGEQLFNRSLLTGKPIDRSTGEGAFAATSEGQGTRDRLRRLGEGLFPSLTPGLGLGARKFSEAMDQTPIDLEGSVTRDKALTAWDVLAGIKVREVQPDDQYEKAKRSIDALVEKKLARVTALRKEPKGYRGRSEEDRDEERAELADEILALENRRRAVEGKAPLKSVDELPKKIRDALARR